MPILDLQRRLREAGRIRIGERRTAKSGKSYPAKLETFRLTSTDREAIHAAASIYGGTAREWKDAPAGTGKQWEVVTDTDRLPVIVPPGDVALSQWMEAWTGGGCVRRCDGTRELLSDQPCVCAAKGLDGRDACSPHTRVNVMLKQLPTFGVWRLETQGWNAAQELAGVVELCSRATASGRMLPATLRLEQRSSISPGEAAKHFAVPVLDVGLTPEQMGLVLGAAPMPELASPVPAVGAAVAALEAPALDADVDVAADPVRVEPSNLTPVPDTVPEAPAPPIAAQLATAFKTPSPQKNAAAPIPATGAAVHSIANEIGDDDPQGPVGEDPVPSPLTDTTPSPNSVVSELANGEQGEEDQEHQPSAHPHTTTGGGEARAAGGASSPELVNTEGAQNVARWCREIGIGDDQRGRFLGAASSGRYWSAHDVPVDDLAGLRSLCLDVFHGKVRFMLVDADRGQLVTTDGEIVTLDGVPVDALPMPAGVFWKERCAATRGIGQSKFVRAAREIAGRLELDLPSGFDTMPDDQRLRREMLAWLADQGVGA